MSAHPDTIERCALAIYREFIGGGYPIRQLRDHHGKPLYDGEQPIFEDPADAAERRWKRMPELSRERFRREASAALEAA